MTGRARDEGGRPRNDRPRDRLGRPLPWGSPGVEPVPDELDLTPPQALDYAQELLDAGRPFGAHEVLEAVWKSCPPDERGLWRALAQLAVGVTHLERGNLRGAGELCRRAVEGATPYLNGERDPDGGAPYGLALEELIAVGRSVVRDLDEGRVPPTPRLRLRG